MKKSGGWHFSLSRRKTRHDSGSHGGGIQESSNFSKDSICSVSESGRANLPGQTPLLRAVRSDLSISFVSCFVSRSKKKKKSGEGDNLDLQTGLQTPDVSIDSVSKKSSKSKNSDSKSSSIGMPCPGLAQLSLAEIRRATGNFSEENVIGRGGFGTVYKGRLKDGSLIAVKRAKMDMQNKGISLEFRSEIETLSRIEHQNLVRFFGCLEQEQEQILAIEYCSNGTLREHLDGIRGDGLELAQRLDIAIDIAHAVTYLHTYTDHPIIHRDIKASNILLTENLRAKVADFGFARLAADNPEATHVSTQIKGTTGYLDPEYLRTYQLTEKSDVYSFGVLLVELITGRRPVERGRDRNKDRISTRWAMQAFRQGEVVMAMDPRLRRNPAAIRAVDEMMALAYLCLASPRRSRPSMKRCAEVLWGIRRDYRNFSVAAERRSAGDVGNNDSLVREEE